MPILFGDDDTNYSSNPADEERARQLRREFERVRAASYGRSWDSPGVAGARGEIQKSVNKWRNYINSIQTTGTAGSRRNRISPLYGVSSSFNPSSVLQTEVLSKVVSQEIAKSYNPLSKPVQQLLVENFSKTVQKTAGYQYGHLPSEITPDVDRRLTTAQRMAIGQRVDGEVGQVVRQMAKMAGFSVKEMETFARGSRPKGSNLDSIRNRITKVGLRFDDFKTLVKLSSPTATYGDMQNAIYGSFVRSLAHFSDAREHGDFWESYDSASLGVIENMGRFNPSQASSSGHAGYWLLQRAFGQTRASERATARSFTLSNYEATNPVTAAQAVLKEFTGIYGVSASTILKKYGLEMGDQFDPGIAKYIVSHKADILGYTQGNLGIFETNKTFSEGVDEGEFGYHDVVPDVAEGAVIYANEANAMARLLPRMVGKHGLPTGYYTASGQLFDDTGHFSPLHGYQYGKQAIPQKRKGDPYYAQGYYFTGTDTIMSVHNRGKSWTNASNRRFQNDPNPAIQTGKFKQLILSPDDIKHFLTLDPRILGDKDREVYNKLLPQLKQTYNVMNAVVSGSTDDQEALRDLSQRFEDEAGWRTTLPGGMTSKGPISTRHTTLPEGVLWRRDFIEQKFDKNTGLSIGHYDKIARRFISPDEAELANRQYGLPVHQYPNWKTLSASSVGPAEKQAYNLEDPSVDIFGPGTGTLDDFFNPRLKFKAGRQGSPNFRRDDNIRDDFEYLEEQYLHATQQLGGMVQKYEGRFTPEALEKLSPRERWQSRPGYVRKAERNVRYWKSRLINSETGNLHFLSPESTGSQGYDDTATEYAIKQSRRVMLGYPEEQRTDTEARMRTDTEMRLLASQNKALTESVIEPYQRLKGMIGSAQFESLSEADRQAILGNFNKYKTYLSKWTASNREYTTSVAQPDQYDSSNPDADLVAAARRLGRSNNIFSKTHIADKSYYPTRNAIVSAGPLTVEARKELGLPLVDPRAPDYQFNQRNQIPTSEIGLDGPVRRRQPLSLDPSESGVMPLSRNVSYLHRRPEPRRFSEDNPARYLEGVPMVDQQSILASRSGNMLIYGQAGAGKTELLGNLQIDAARRRGIRPDRHLFLTGTTTARENWYDRLDKLEGSPGDAINFHQLGFRALKKISGTHGVPSDFSGHNIMLPLDYHNMTADILERLPNTPQRFVEGSYNQEFGSYVHKYAKAAEDYRSQMMSQRDYGTKLFDDFVNENNLEPELFQYVFNKSEEQLKSQGKFTFSKLISEPAMIMAQEQNPELNKRMVGGYDAITIDEINQVGTAALSLTTSTMAANPRALLTAGGDPLQMLWNFIKGSPQNAETIARVGNMQKVNLNQNYRLDQGAVDIVGRLFNLPDEMKPRVVDRQGNILPVQGTEQERINNFLKDSYLVENAQDRNRLVVDKVRALKDAGVANKDIMFQGATKREVAEISEALQNAGFSTWSKPNEMDYIHAVLSDTEGSMTPERAKMLMDERMTARTDDDILGTTVHSGQGAEAMNVITSMSQADLASMPDMEARALVGVAATRGIRGGTHTFVSQQQRGGAPKVLKELGGAWAPSNQLNEARSMQPRRTSSTTSGSRARSSELITSAGDFIDEDRISNRIASTFERRGPMDGPEAAYAATGAVVAQRAAVDALEQLRQSPPQTRVEFARKFDQIVQDAILERTEAFVGEGATPGQQSIRGYAQEYGRSVSGLVQEALGRTPNHLAKGVNSKWTEYHPFGWSGDDEGYDGGGTSGGGGGGGGRRGGGSQPSGFYGRNPMAAFGRGVYALSMAWNVARRGFEAESTDAKRYSDYLSTFGHFAAQDGAFGTSEYGDYAKRVVSERMMQKGAYEQFGAFTTMPYAMAKAGADWIPRMSSAANVGFQTIVGGAEAAYGLSIMGQAGGMPWAAAAAKSVAVGAGVVGGTIIGGAALMEGYNAIAQPKKNLSWGELGNQVLKHVYTEINYGEAASRYKEYQGIKEGQDTGGDKGRLKLAGQAQNFAFVASGGMTSPAAYFASVNQAQTPREASPEEIRDISWEEVVKEKFPSIYWQVEGEASQMANNVRDMSEAIFEKYGIPVEKSQSMAARVLGENNRSWYGGRVSSKDVGLTLQSKATALGYSSGEEYYGVIAQQAGNMGYLPGSKSYQDYIGSQMFAQGQTREQVELQNYYTQRVGQYGSQLAGYFVTPGMGEGMVSSFGMMTQPQVGAASAMGSTVQMYGGTQYQTQIAMGLSSYETPAQAQAIAGIGQMYGNAGLDPMTAITSLAGQNMPMNQLNLMGAIAGGDIGALSYASWNKSFGEGSYTNWGNRFYDQLGDPIYMRSGNDFSKWADANQIGPNVGVGLANVSSNAGMTGLSGADWFRNYFGGGGSDAYYQAWAQGGLKGAQTHVQGQMAEYSMASIGIQMQQLNLQRSYLWGSGTYDKPGAGSSWYIEDQMRALQHQSTLAGFASSQKSMEANYAYSQQTEGANLQRMETQHGYQRWMSSFDRMNSLRQRTWTKEDWGYQDTMRGLSYEWGMEDINESIRGATGRERRLLIRKRDRMGTQHNLEEEQVDTQRERQEEMWALEDQRYQKVTEYQESLMELDTEGFELNKTHREEMHQLDVEEFERRKQEYAEQKKLQDEALDLQRKHQAESMELQEKSLGIQAASAALQKQLANDQKKIMADWEIHLKKLDNLNRYDPAKGNIALMEGVIEEFGKANSANITNVKEVLQALNKNLPGADAMINLVTAINGVDFYRLNAIVRLLSLMD
jgi:hypothetical protein